MPVVLLRRPAPDVLVLPTRPSVRFERPMMSLPVFLLARLDEDEAAAKAAGPDGGEWSSRYADSPEFHMYGDFGWVVSGPGVETEDSEWGRAVADHIARHDPARVLADVEAKRRIVESFAAGGPYERGTDAYAITGMVLRLLALPYADHEDYLEEWKP